MVFFGEDIVGRGVEGKVDSLTAFALHFPMLVTFICVSFNFNITTLYLSTLTSSIM